jgi:ribosome-binding factor A
MERKHIRFNHLVQEELSKAIMRFVETEPGVLITITRVEVSVDFKYAKVFVTVYPQKTQGTVLKTIRKHRKEYEYHLADVVKNGQSPQLEFLLDDSVVKGFQVEEILDSLDYEE